MSTTEQPVSNGAAVPAPSDRVLLDEVVHDMVIGAARWVALPLKHRADVLRETHHSIGRQSDRWVRTAADIKRLAPASFLVGAEWITETDATLMGLGALTHSVEILAQGGFPVPERALGTDPGGHHTPEGVQSGTGVVHNAMLLDAPERTVLHGELALSLTPAWFAMAGPLPAPVNC